MEMRKLNVQTQVWGRANGMGEDKASNYLKKRTSHFILVLGFLLLWVYMIQMRF